MAEKEKNFQYVADRFADICILRYQVPGFDGLTLKQKSLIYCLSEAALSGRDILFDQNGKYNLLIRRILDTIVERFSGTRNEQFTHFLDYTRQIWFASGIYHHYSSDKILPQFSKNYFIELVYRTDWSDFPLQPTESIHELIEALIPVIFDPEILPVKVSQDTSGDIVKNSAVNFYDDVTQREVEEYYEKLKNPDDKRPPSYGLNSKITKKEGRIIEKTWQINGMYHKAIEQIAFWLQEAIKYAENHKQKHIIRTLISFYQSADLREFDRYNILWLDENEGRVDFINGFIENYSDPLGMKGTWEGLVNFVDEEATRRTKIISAHAQWFENNSPVDDRFKKEKVTGVSAKAVLAVQLGGDCYPHTPIGINLPNPEWIRERYGSKSVTLDNIMDAHHEAEIESGVAEEFSLDEQEVQLLKEHGALANKLHVDLHECLGHGSGKTLPNVSVRTLKNYYAPLEETRADLFALYFIGDKKMAELGLVPSFDVVKAQYMSYIRNGLMIQLWRIKPGRQIEQAHMRNRQLIAGWCYEKGHSEKIIELIKKNGKTYFKINDYPSLRKLFGQLLNEVQRIKSEGDYEAGKRLVENYGVQVDRQLHSEVLDRMGKLDVRPFTGFINPLIEAIKDGDRIIDVKLNFETDYDSQMMYYGKKYSFPDIK